MEAAIQTMVKVFLKSSKGKEGLQKKDFHNLVKSQLSNILQDTDSKEAVNNMGQGLDENQDGKVGFEEYMKLVGYLAVSLSEQRSLAKEEQAPSSNATSEQQAKCAADKPEEKPEANAEAKEEAKPEANEEPKAEACANVKVEANAGTKIEAKAEGVMQPEAPKEEPAAAAATAFTAAAESAGGAAAKAMSAVEAAGDEAAKAVSATEAAAEDAATATMTAATKVVESAESAVEVAVKEEGKLEEDAGKLATALGEEVEKKIEEVTS